jgi:hypothetical protein
VAQIGQDAQAVPAVNQPAGHLSEKHLAGELHPDTAGATIIAKDIFTVLSAVHQSVQESSP